MLETSFQSAITISLICCCCCCCYCVASRSQKIYGAASGMGPVFNYHISTPRPPLPYSPLSMATPDVATEFDLEFEFEFEFQSEFVVESVSNAN